MGGKGGEKWSKRWLLIGSTTELKSRQHTCSSRRWGVESREGQGQRAWDLSGQWSVAECTLVVACSAITSNNRTPSFQLHFKDHDTGFGFGSGYLALSLTLVSLVVVQTFCFYFILPIL